MLPFGWPHTRTPFLSSCLILPLVSTSSSPCPRAINASSRWFAKAINEFIRGLEQVAAYLDDVLVFGSDSTAHVKTIRALFDRLRKRNLKLSHWKPRLSATDADSLGHSFSPEGARPKMRKMCRL